MRLLYPLVIFILVISSCRDRQNKLTDEEKRAIISDVQRTLNDYYAAIRERGLTAEFDYLDSSDEFFWVPPGSKVALSYDSVYRVLSLNALLFKSIASEWDTLRVAPLTAELAMYTGRLRSTSTDTAGSINSVKLVETGLMIKRNNGWKLLNGQTSVLPE